MNKPTAIILISASLTIIASLIIILALNHNASLSPSAILEKCNSINYNGENKLGILFFADKNSAEEYSKTLFSISPFSNNKDSFNVFYIDSYSPECELYENIALLCYSKEIIKKASSCPADYIVVLDNKNQEIRSSSFMNVLSINKAHKKNVIAHEFAHAFANLAEEYVPAKIARNSKNCASACDKFQNNTDGCFQGCSEESYQRSINSGLMRTLSSSTFGKFDESLIQQKIPKSSSEITGNAVQTETGCSQQEYYLIQGYYENNSIEIKSKTKETGCINFNGAGPFNYSLALKDNTLLDTKEFNSELVFTDIPDAEGDLSGNTYQYKGEFFLKVPYAEAESLEIKGAENKAEISFKDKGARACSV